MKVFFNKKHNNIQQNFDTKNQCITDKEVTNEGSPVYPV